MCHNRVAVRKTMSDRVRTSERAIEKNLQARFPLSLDRNIVLINANLNTNQLIMFISLFLAIYARVCVCVAWQEVCESD